MVEAIKQLPDIGFIIALNAKQSEYKIVNKANLKNVLLKEFVPQKEILNDPKVFGFVTHGGASSIMESLYYGTILIGFPIGGD